MQRDDKTLSLQSRSGFSLVELLVYMVILGVLMALVMTSFTQTQRRSAQQSGIAETQIETGVGLGLLRADLASAGFGLPWVAPTALGYQEPGALGVNILNLATVPAALDSANNIAFGGSDRLVIRATSATQDPVGQRWGTVGRNAAHATAVQSAVGAALAGADWVIAVQLGNSDHPETFRSLAMSGAVFPFLANPAGLAGVAPDGTPYDPNGEKLLLYGISGAAQPVRPFNRTDYYIPNPDPNVDPNGFRPPAHCAPGTGVLVKAILNPDNNIFGNPQPVADCVADFQVVYLIPAAGGGLTAVPAVVVGADPARDIREQVREVRCFILLHEGGIDRSYTYPNAVGTIRVGDVVLNGANVAPIPGRVFNLTALPGIGADWVHYRWKVVSVTVTPRNLRQ